MSTDYAIRHRPKITESCHNSYVDDQNVTDVQDQQTGSVWYDQAENTFKFVHPSFDARTTSTQDFQYLNQKSFNFPYNGTGLPQTPSWTGPDNELIGHTWNVGSSTLTINKDCILSILFRSGANAGTLGGEELWTENFIQDGAGNTIFSSGKRRRYYDSGSGTQNVIPVVKEFAVGDQLVFLVASNSTVAVEANHFLLISEV